MNNRFKFRAWDIEEKKLIDAFCIKDYMCLLNEIFEDDYYIFMQCTGLKDSEGNLIYEGDIVIISNNLHFKNPHAFICKWDDFYLQFIFSETNNKFVIDSPDSSNIEIIGNIYENPELLNIKGEG
jgi:uncharacterized phage protein (TIGR01671 family)